MKKSVVIYICIAMVLAIVGVGSAIEYAIYDDFSDGDYTNNPTWTVLRGSGFQIVDGALSYSSKYGDEGVIQLESDTAYGTWEFRDRVDGTDGHYEFRHFRFIVVDSNNLYDLTMGEVYSGNKWELHKLVDGQWIHLDSHYTYLPSNVWTEVKITRNFDGEINVYTNGELIISATDNTHTISNYIQWHGQSNGRRKYIDDLRVTAAEISDNNKGHGNDPDGGDEDNPGRGCEKKNDNGNRKRC